MKHKFLLNLALGLLILYQPVAAKPASRVVIGAGNAGGGYFLLGAAICEQVNLGSASHNVRCAVEPSKGTVANLQALRDGHINLALAQSDWQHHAYAGTAAKFSGASKVPELRALLSLTASPLVLLSRADGAISGVNDLPGKRLDIGKPGTGRRAAADDLIAALGWDLGKFKLASELDEEAAIAALCGGQIDVLALAGAIPDRGIAAALKACPMAPVPVSGPAAARLIADKPYYSAVRIPAGTYPGLKGDLDSVGVRVILAASSKLPEPDAYAIVKSVAGNLDALRKLHPSLSGLNRKDLAKASISVPLHDGAARYYRETGKQ